MAVSAISKFLRSAEGGRLLFYCRGCGMAHQVSVGDGPGPRWGYNGNPDKPTFTPSVRVRWTHGPQHEPRVCHTFVTDGRIQYLGDCTHALAGQTIDLPEFRWGEDDPDDEEVAL